MEKKDELAISKIALAIEANARVAHALAQALHALTQESRIGDGARPFTCAELVRAEQEAEGLAALIRQASGATL